MKLEEFFKTFTTGSLLLASIVASCEAEYGLQLGESLNLNFLGCYSISPFITQTFKQFPSRICSDTNPDECRNWCLDKRVVTPNYSIFLLQENFCLCTTWNKLDLKGPFFQLINGTSCLYDEELRSFSIYEYNSFGEITTTDPNSNCKDLLNICTVGSCGKLNVDFFNLYHVASATMLYYPDSDTSVSLLNVPEDCVNVAQNLLKINESKNQTIAFLAIVPVDRTYTSYNCTAFTFIEDPFINFNSSILLEIVMNYYGEVDPNHCIACPYSIEPPNCGGFSHEGDSSHDLSSLYYVTYGECTNSENNSTTLCPIDQSTTEHLPEPETESTTLPTSIYEPPVESTTTDLPNNIGTMKICLIAGECGNFSLDIFKDYKFLSNYTVFMPVGENTLDSCMNMAHNFVSKAAKFNEPSNQAIAFISIFPVLTPLSLTEFNCTVFTFLENPLIHNFLDIVMGYFNYEDFMTFIPCALDESTECYGVYYCGGYSNVEGMTHTLSSLYYVTFEDNCIPRNGSGVTMPNNHCSNDPATTKANTETVETTEPDRTPAPSTLPTDISSSTEENSNDDKITTLQSPETTPSTCDESQRCKQYDNWNNYWTACSYEIAIRPCKNDENSYATWKCLSNGQFEGLFPDYSNCKSEWIEEIDKRLEEMPSIPANETQTILDMIYNRTKDSIEQNRQNYYGHEIKHIFSLSRKLIHHVHEETNISTFEYLSYKSIGIMTMLYEYQKPWEDLDLINRTETGTEFIHSSESTALELTERISNNQSYISDEQYRYEFNASGLQMGCGAQLKNETERGGGKLCYPFNYIEDYGNYVKIPDNWTDYFDGKYKDVQFVAMQIDSMLVNTVFPANLSQRAKSNLNEVTSNWIINSKLLSFTFNSTAVPRVSTGLNFTGMGIKIHFTHEVFATGERKRNLRRKLHPGESPRAVLGSSECVYWDPKNLIWSSEGCHLIESCKTKTKCECLHLSSFALLMDTHNYVGKDKVLEFFTWVLCPASIICLLLCILVFALTGKSGRGPRTDITTNLCICLLFGNLILLAFSDRNYFHLSDGICAVFGSLLHYFFLSAFVWMGIEGIQLYRKVIIIFDNGKDYKLLEFVTGYGLPILGVGLTWVIGVLRSEDVYGGDEFCWLEGNYIWAFLGPILLVSIGNITILIVSLRIAYKIEKNPKAHMIGSQKVNSIAKWIRGTMSISVLLGVTWIMGFLMLAYEMSIFVSYLFTILNASQGILLFVFHCCMNANVMDTFRRKLCIRSSFKSSLTKKTDSSTLQLASNSSSSSSFNTKFSKKNFN